jgi:hypothetical protein
VDISSDAHPTRVLRGNDVADVVVCRDCYRAAELEFRIACESSGLPYAPLSIRDGLRRLAFFYRDRLDAWSRDDVLVDEADRDAAVRPIRKALDEVESRLRLMPLRES